MSENVLGGGLVGAEVSGGLASGVAQLGYDALIRHHNEKREDTRYQRLAKDLQASGLSKNIISGATASSQPAPTSDISFLGDSFSKGIDREIQMEQLNIARAKANAELTNMYKTNEQLDAIIKGLNTDNLSKLEDLQHKRNVNAMHDLQVLKTQEEINVLGRDKDRLELERERTKSQVERQNIESDIKRIEYQIAKRDASWLFKTPFPSMFWKNAELKDFYRMNSITLINALKNGNLQGKPLEETKETSPFIDFVRGVMLGNKDVKKYWK